VPLLVAAPDKFRGTATASEIADAAARAAERSGWDAVRLPLADGGEGLLDAVGGEVRTEVVDGPLGEPVTAEWRLVADEEGPTAVIEMARASGMQLVGDAASNDPVAATTRGTGQLVAAAARAGARRIVVGAGGSATTDGGAGALEVLRDRSGLRGARLLVACDVDTPFLDAARVFGPQKGASPDQVELLARRLRSCAASYKERFGVDVTTLTGAGAAGGLAGGLAALGGQIVSGFDLVAQVTGLDRHLAHADLVVTGEGRLDVTSLAGKVVSGVLRRVAPHAPVLVVAGAVADVGPAELAAATGLDPGDIAVVALVDRYGRQRALAETADLVGDVVQDRLGLRSP
jgi:glycerate kinase